MHTEKLIVRYFVSVLVAFSLLVAPFQFPLRVNASANQWIRGASIQSTSQSDFASDSFKQSLKNLKATGATYVALVVPYYQSNTHSTDIQSGWNTPTDTALASAIDYAHSIGLSVAIKVHIESYDGSWRAYINPDDRTTWFQKYGDVLVHLGQIGSAHSAELMILGTEMVGVSSSAINGSNTQNWLSMIARVRGVYKGLLTYNANSTNNNNDPYQNEKNSIGFWSALDMASLSVYYNLNTSDNSVSSLEAQWDYWNKSDLQPFQNKIGKPLLFGEIGFRSVTNAHSAPWDSGMGGGYNATEQTNDYQAMFDYWNNYSYVNGILLWDWSSNPNAGGQNDTNYTPQGKPALQTMTQWFTNPNGPTQKASYQVSGSVAPSPATVNSMATVSATVGVTGTSVQNGLVDIEIYDSSNKQVFQKYFENQSIAAGSTITLTTPWMPTLPGQYRMATGLFTAGWAQNLYWTNSATTVSVQAVSTPPQQTIPTPPPTQQPQQQPTQPSNPPATQNSYTTNIWWPTNGSKSSGVQPFKANIDNLDVSQYTMYWQVDGGTLNQMGNSSEGYPHKESLVDMSQWTWKNQGPYMLTFVSKDKNGVVISQKSATVYTQ